jgi:hypothetical protein
MRVKYTRWEPMKIVSGGCIVQKRLSNKKNFARNPLTGVLVLCRDQMRKNLYLFDGILLKWHQDSTQISIKQPFSDHIRYFSHKTEFLMKLRLSKSGITWWHAPDTIFMDSHLVFDPHTVVDLISTCSKWMVWRPWMDGFRRVESSQTPARSPEGLNSN